MYVSYLYLYNICIYSYVCIYNVFIYSLCIFIIYSIIQNYKLLNLTNSGTLLYSRVVR